MRAKVSVSAVGDFMPQRRIPASYEGFEEVAAFIKRADAAFFNLETTFPDEECFGNQFYGGAYICAGETVLEDAKRYGFNMLSFATNHTLDYSYRGLALTLSAVRRAGFSSAGVGMSLDEASAPSFIDTQNGSLGLIGVVSTMMNVAAMAGRQSRRFRGRPGVNGLRVDDYVEVPTDRFAVLEQIVEESKMNAQADISRAEGFTPPLADGVLSFRGVNVRKGNATRYVTRPNEQDMERILSAIRSARSQCDCVVVSMHSHEVGDRNKECPADFYIEFAHRCIDAGASAILGHGPHLIRPIEIYHGRPIFYSMGNFVFQDKLTEFAAEDQFEKYGVTSDMSMGDFYELRTKGQTRGLLCDRRVMEGFVPYFEVEDDKVVKIELMPIDIGTGLEAFQVGLPRPAYGRGIIERLAEMSAPYGTRITVREDGVGEVVL